MPRPLPPWLRPPAETWDKWYEGLENRLAKSFLRSATDISVLISSKLNDGFSQHDALQFIKQKYPAPYKYAVLGEVMQDITNDIAVWRWWGKPSEEAYAYVQGYYPKSPYWEILREGYERYFSVFDEHGLEKTEVETRQEPRPPPPLFIAKPEPTPRLPTLHRDRCIQCGTPIRPQALNVPDLDAEGGVVGTPYWFCSEACLNQTVKKLTPRRWLGTAEDDSEFQDYLLPLLATGQWENIRNAVADWSRQQNICTSEARTSLITRIRADARHEEAEKLRKEQEKDAERLAAEKEFEQQLLTRPIPDRIRFEHTHILGPSGSGKTTLIEQLILDDLAKPNPPAIVVIDPKGLMVERIARLAAIPRDRLVIVDPTSEPLPALNMFERPPKGTENQVISNFAYIFSQANAALTAKMVPPFMFAVRMMFAIDGANIFTLMDLFDDTAKERKFQPYIERLPDEASRRFFANDFYSSTYSETRQQIKGRLYEIIARPELTEMFNAPVAKLNMFDCLQNRKIVLVNTGMLKLGSTGSQLLGRFIISSTLNAAFRRSLIHRDQWNAAYLYIDEFQDFADQEKTPELLRLAREYNLGVVLAHQNMHCNELNESLRTTISTNTSIKYCSMPEAIDQTYMARDLRCDTDFFKTHTSPGMFACFVRGMNLQHPFKVYVPFGAISKQPQMPDADYRARVSALKTQLHAPQMQKRSKEGLLSHESVPPQADKPIAQSGTPKAEPIDADSDPHTGDHTKPATRWGD